MEYATAQLKAIEVTMRSYFAERQDLIDHTMQVTTFAKQLLAMNTDPTVDVEVVLGAALMHDIGIVEAERKHGNGSGHFQEIEGPPIVKHLLQGLNLPANYVEEVCSIVAHHHSPGVIQTANFALLYDADWLVNLPNQYAETGESVPSEAIAARYLTSHGRELAIGLFGDQE